MPVTSNCVLDSPSSHEQRGNGSTASQGTVNRLQGSPEGDTYNGLSLLHQWSRHEITITLVMVK